MKKVSKEKRILNSLSSVGIENSKNQRDSSIYTQSGFSTFITIQNTLQKSWRNIPKHNKEWDELMKDVFIPFLYYIDKSQCITKHYKKMYESDGYEVEYDENNLNEDVDNRWKRWLERFKMIDDE